MNLHSLVCGAPERARILANSVKALQKRVNRMQRVLVRGNHRLLGAGIENLLRREADLLVFGVTLESEAALVQAIDRSQPDVVVLDGSTIDPAAVLALLQNYLKLRVLLVSADDGLIRTYETRQVVVTQAAELVDLVRS